MIDRIAYVAIGDGGRREELIRFYCELFGLVEVAKRDSTVFLSGGKKHGFDLSIGPWPAGLFCFAFQLGEASLVALEEKLRTAAIPFENIDPGENPLIRRGIRLVLPSGHLMELVVLSGDERFEETPFIDRQHFAGGGPVALEHVSIDCDDVEATVGFCVELLGFRVSEFSKQADGPWFLAFVRCSERHHDLGVFRPSPGWTGAGLNHYAFVVPSIAEIVRVADAARSLGYILECSPGRHVLGDNIFIYLRDPTGNRIEIATPLSRVDWETPARAWDAGSHREWSNFDAWRKDVPPAARDTLPCFDARKA